MYLVTSSTSNWIAYVVCNLGFTLEYVNICQLSLRSLNCYLSTQLLHFKTTHFSHLKCSNYKTILQRFLKEALKWYKPNLNCFMHGMEINGSYWTYNTRLLSKMPDTFHLRLYPARRQNFKYSNMFAVVLWFGEGWLDFGRKANNVMLWDLLHNGNETDIFLPNHKFKIWER